MKKRVSFIIALLVSMVVSFSMAVADYDSNEQLIPSVGGRDFYIKNGISDNRRDAYAKTTGGTNSYNSVTDADFYYLNYTTHQAGHYLNRSGSGSTTVKVDAPTLSYGENKRYYEVISNHSGSFGAGSFTYTGLQTLID